MYFCNFCNLSLYNDFIKVKKRTEKFFRAVINQIKRLEIRYNNPVINYILIFIKKKNNGYSFNAGLTVVICYKFLIVCTLLDDRDVISY